MRLENLNFGSVCDRQRIVHVTPDDPQYRPGLHSRLPFTHMTPPTPRLLLLILLSLCTGTSLAAAAPHGSVAATLNPAALVPEQPAELDITLTINPGYHAQSHKPADAYLIPLVVTMQPSPGMTFGDPQYPLGEDVNDPVLGHENIYTNNVVIHVPVTVSAAAASPVPAIHGKVMFQACDSRACYPPVILPFVIE